jgi:hypothetical protein
MQKTETRLTQTKCVMYRILSLPLQASDHVHILLECVLREFGPQVLHVVDILREELLR